MKILYKFSSLLILIFILFTAQYFAANGKITGRVTDAESGEPLISANVLIIEKILDDGTVIPLDSPIGASTDLDGYYVILNVPPSVYNLRASIIGYTPRVVTSVNVSSDRTIEVSFPLSSTVIEVEQVVVTADKEVIKKDVSGTREIIETSRIEQMPVMRVDEFVDNVKGVELVSGAEGNGLSVRGGAIRETDIRLDGISLQDPRTESSYLGFNSTTIEEVQIMTGGFEAKYGGIRSGLLNVVTKDGNREKYTVSVKTDIAPSQKKFFETNPWSDDSWIYRVYADTSENGYAWQGVAEDDSTVPAEFRGFKGWSNARTEPRPLDSLQKLQLWKLQHPQYPVADRPDYFFETSVTGPVPGSFIPLWGDYADRSTFLLGFKYEDSKLAFPIGPRDSYVDWNLQLKLTTQLKKDMRLSVNGLYSKIETVSGGSSPNYGGALVGQQSSFGFLNSTESSVRQQARLINGFFKDQIYNKSRLQFYDQRNFAGGVKFTHTLSNKAFYTLDFQVGYSDQNLQPFAMDTSVASNYVSFFSERAGRDFRYITPENGSPNASTNYGYDEINYFRMYGGTQRVDSSHSYIYRLKGDLTTQIGRHHQIETGFSLNLHDLFVYSGTWFQSEKSFTPDTWQYFSSTPLELGLYAQDKLEFQGIVLNLGARIDYFNPMQKGYSVGFPDDEDYTNLFNRVYPTLPGEPNSYERWVAWRELLQDPEGWPQKESEDQFHISPRLGVSFPITETSKMYFNYGHFYQRAPIEFLYKPSIYPAAIVVPTPDLAMGKTVQFEFGYEQVLLWDLLFNVSAYYKDISNEPLGRTFINYNHDNNITKYFPDRYRDIRGFELRLERALGRFITFNAMYEYQLASSGQSGLAVIYENRIEAREGELRNPNIINTEPLPRANINLNLHTPKKFGPSALGINPFGSIYTNFFFEWRDQGRILLNPEETDIKLRNYIDIVNFWNIDFRASKTFNTGVGDLELVLTIQNLTNNKWLRTENMDQNQMTEYKNSLQTPDKGGDDKWGEYKEDYIETGWWTAPLYLNPRRYILGFRLNL